MDLTTYENKVNDYGLNIDKTNQELIETYLRSANGSNEVDPDFMRYTNFYTTQNILSVKNCVIAGLSHIARTCRFDVAVIDDFPLIEKIMEKTIEENNSIEIIMNFFSKFPHREALLFIYLFDNWKAKHLFRIYEYNLFGAYSEVYKEYDLMNEILRIIQPKFSLFKNTLQKSKLGLNFIDDHTTKEFRILDGVTLSPEFYEIISQVKENILGTEYQDFEGIIGELEEKTDLKFGKMKIIDRLTNQDNITMVDVQRSYIYFIKREEEIKSWFLELFNKNAISQKFPTQENPVIALDRDILTREKLIAKDELHKVINDWLKSVKLEDKKPVESTKEVKIKEELSIGEKKDVSKIKDGRSKKSKGTSPLVEKSAKETGRIFLGMSNNGEKVFWNPEEMNNGHMLILGGSGAGKTETLKVLTFELSKKGYPVILIDFHGEMHSGIDPSKIQTYEIKEGENWYFNPFELDPMFENITPLRSSSDFVHSMVVNFSSLGSVQKSRIKSSIRESFEKLGLSSDPSTWNKEIDITHIRENIVNSNLYPYFQDIFDYNLFDGNKKIPIQDLFSGISHFNLKFLPESLRSLYADLLLRKIFYNLSALQETSGERKIRLYIVVDEAKLLVSERKGSKAVINKFATEIRKFGGGLILASQTIDHFNDEILANVSVKFCMKAENKKEAKKNNSYFNVDTDLLLNLDKGQGILSGINETNQIVQIVQIWKRQK